MKRLLSLVSIWLILLTFFTHASTEHLSYTSLFSQLELKQLLRDKIEPIVNIAKTPKIIHAVKESNKHLMSFSEIDKIDKQWRNKHDLLAFKQSLLGNSISLYLKDFIETQPTIYTEAFLTDKKGANIALFPLTSDYMQGDELKWQKAYNNSLGNVYISKVSFDESTQTNSLQISVPIMDNNLAIGVLVIGVRLTYIQAKVMGAPHTKK